jgi:hypothetical protein
VGPELMATLGHEAVTLVELEGELPVPTPAGPELEVVLRQKNLRLRDGDADPRGYKHVWRLFTNVARDFGVDVTVADTSYWRTILGLSRGLDDLVDDDGAQDLQNQVTVLSRGVPVGGIGSVEAQAFRRCLSLLPEDRRVMLLGHDGLARATVHAKERAAASTARQLVEINRVEAHWYASLLELPILDQRDEPGRKKFNTWLQTFCISGYAFDSANDMRKDYARDQIAVAPKARARAVMILTAVWELARGAYRTPKRRLGQIAYIGFRNRYPVYGPDQASTSAASTTLRRSIDEAVPRPQRSSTPSASYIGQGLWFLVMVVSLTSRIRCHERGRPSR